MLLPAALVLATTPQTATPPAPSPQGPTATWRTVRTAHYRIHYPTALEDFARDVAGRVEPIHELLRKEIGRVHDGGIDILIQDPALDANGFAQVGPTSPRVTLYARQPKSHSGIGHERDWTELLLLHELVHIHHLSWPQHRPTALQRLKTWPGAPLPVARKTPRWVREGFATLLEGRLTGNGRPHSAYRAGLLRTFALQGMLPAYDSLDTLAPPHSGQFAYLVGSAFLEWLETRPGAAPDALRTLWRHLASPRNRTFDSAFQATFGQGPTEAYLRFRAEVTADALAAERRALAAGWVRDGKVFAQTATHLNDLAMNPAGTHLAAFSGGPQGGIQLWDLAEAKPKPTPAKPAAPDPEIPDPVASLRPDRPPVKRIFHHQGWVPRSPHWLDAATLAFEVHVPDHEGTLQPRSARLQPFGPRQASTQISFERLDPVTREGLSVLHVDGRPLPLPGPAVGPATRVGSLVYATVERESSWHLVTHDLATGITRTVGRSLGLAWNPVPSPDGKQLYFLTLAPSGTQIRQLELGAAPLPEGPLPLVEAFAPGTLVSRADAPTKVPPAQPIPAARPYRPTAHQSFLVQPLLLETPSTRAVQLAASGQDLVGQASWEALGSFGSEGAGPRGGSLSAAWKGWAWAPRVQAFSSLEDVSRQRLVPVPGLRLDRKGAEVAFHLTDLSETPYHLTAALAGERVIQGTQASVHRHVLSLEGTVQTRVAPGPGLKVAFRAGAWAGTGRTAGQNWRLARLEGTLQTGTAQAPGLLTTRVEWGRLGGDPTPMDRFRLGGLSHGLVASSLALNQVDQVALPAFLLTGTHLERLRLDVGSSVRFYGEITRLGDETMARQRLVGLEAPFWSGFPRFLGHPSRSSAFLGIHRAFDGPMKGRTVGTFTLLFRP